MKRSSFRREMLLLCAPLVGFGVVAILLTARERRRIERESGPLRLVIESVESKEVTPLEAWRGFDAKWRMRVGLAGQTAQRQKPTLVVKNVSSWIDGTNRLNPNPQVLQNIETLRENDLWVTANLMINAPATNAEALRLRVVVKGGCHFGAGPLVGAQPATSTVPFDSTTHAAQHVSREAPVVMSVSTKETQLPKPVVTISARVRPPKWNDHSGRDWSCLKPRLLDAKGREIETAPPLDTNGRRFNPDSASTFRAVLDISKIPISRGKLTYEAWLSCDQSWPVKVSCVVRS